MFSFDDHFVIIVLGNVHQFILRSDIMLEWENPEIARINREEPHCIFIPFRMKPIQKEEHVFVNDDR